MRTDTMPEIKANGKKYVMPKPKIKLWRSIIRFMEEKENGGKTSDEVFDGMLDLVVLAFNNPEVTRDFIEENLSLDDLVDIFNHLGNLVMNIAEFKAGLLPNQETPAKI